MTPSHHVRNIISATMLSLILYKIVAQPCESDYSTLSMKLQKHTYRNLKTSSALECHQACNDDVRCQSFNYVFLEDVCELNNRTKEARPEDFVPDLYRYYLRRTKKLVPLGSIPELPAETCKEIKASEGGKAVSGKYWFDSLIPGEVVLAQCNMEKEDIDECSASKSLCAANATGCQNTVGSFTCSCQVGFSGRHCNDVDECRGSVKPCDINADCQNTQGSYVCLCKTGYSGNGRACTDVDECSASEPVCHVNANCTNIVGSYLCSCKSGFLGDGKTCTDYNECDAPVAPCDPLASCQNTAGSFVCLCQRGYKITGDGRTCTDADECSSPQSPCHANAICGNTVGSFTCSCKTGYSGNGLICTDVNECSSPQSPCHANAICGNTVGSFTCSCKAGYNGNGLVCTDADECSSPQSPCHANAICRNTVGSFTCSCKTGYNGNGLVCADADECSSPQSPCHANAICGNTVGSYTCSCKPGYNGNGLVCTDVDECAQGSHNCLPNAASCVNTAGTYRCVCNNGYVGDGITSCQPSSECNTYQVLDTSDRRTTNTRGCRQCDDKLVPGWYRFQGDAGTRMPTTCPATSRCDTCAPGWLNGAHPTTAEGKVTRQVCFHYSSNCCSWTVNIEVRNCGSHYVYNLPVSPACYLRYCSTD